MYDPAQQNADCSLIYQSVIIAGNVCEYLKQTVRFLVFPSWTLLTSFV